MPINYEAAKTLVNGLIQKMKSFRGNWDQNDPNADDYIKNRPFYTGDLTEKILFTESFANSDTVDWGQTKVGYISEYYGDSYVLNVNEKYIVYFDDTQFECVAFIENEYDNVVIGNGKFVGDSNTDNNLPFAIGTYDIGSNMCYIIVGDTDTHTVSVKSFYTPIHKIDSKYLPAMDYVSYNEEQYLTEDQQGLARWNIGAGTSDFSGSYLDLTNKPTIYTDVVRYNIGQSLTNAQQTQARTNIGAASTTDISTATSGTVKYTMVQYLDDAQKSQARKNIGAAHISEVVRYDTSQGLTDAQKSQARTNIGAISSNYSELTSAPKYDASRKHLEVNSIYTDDEWAADGPYLKISSNSIRFIDGESRPQYDNSVNIVGPTAINKDDGFATLKFKGHGFVGASNSIYSIPVRLNGIADPVEDNDAATKGYIDNKIFDCITLRDKINSYNYVIEMRNGELVTRLMAAGVTLTAPPDKTAYRAGEKFDPTGMVITVEYPDGNTAIVENYSYNRDYFVETDTYIEVYCDVGGNYSIIIPITVEPFDESLLQDFEYTVNDDGTYTITAWKETLNGQPSTEMIVPDFPIINI